jgi:predicted transposase YdaD
LAEGILSEFLTKYKYREVINLIKLFYDEDMAIEVAREEGREEGMEKGIKKGREEGIKKGMEETINKIAKETGLNLEKLQEMVYKEVFQ